LPRDVTIVAVSKGRSSGEIMSLYQRGHRDFGENRAAEFSQKVDLLPGDIRWHFVGPLQTNKVRLVRPGLSLLHSMDRLALAGAWMKGPGLPPPVLVQVNVGSEPQKSGVDPVGAPDLVTAIVRLGVRVDGVMAIPPAVVEAEAARPYFRELKAIAVRLEIIRSQAGLEVPGRISPGQISMGMTDDFEVAVEEGATLIRVGRAIFGESAR
jgi:pyridoxal phosphate enzyme (YggS family)